MIAEELERGEPIRVTRSVMGREMAADWFFFNRVDSSRCIIFRRERGQMIKKAVSWRDIETIRRMR